MTQRLLGVAVTLALAMVMAMPAHARTSKQKHQTAKVECFSDVDRGGARMICGAQQASVAQRGHQKARASHAAPEIALVHAPSASLVAEARRYLGTNPTGRRSLWCGAFMSMVLERAGYKPGGNLARAYASYGQRVSGPQVGAIAVMTRGKDGGHVGVISGIDENGNLIVVSGNHNDTVAESVYPRSRVIAYVVPGA